MTAGAERRALEIVYVIDSLNVGGAELMLIGLVRSCLSEGHRVTVAHFTPGPLSDELDRMGVAVHRLSRHGLRDPSVVVRLRRLLARLRPDVVHTHLRKSDLAGQLAAAWAGVPARLSTIHSTAPWKRRRTLNLLARSLTAGCHCFIACGDEVREYAMTVGGLSRARVEVIENGIDVERFDPARIKTRPRAEPTIGIVGRLQPAKGHRFFIQAARLLARERPDVRFVVVGDGPLRAGLLDDVARAGLDRTFEFTGLVRDIPEVVGSLGIVTVASIFEGLPLALLEAMALERPIVATRVGGIPGVIADGVDGLLIDAADPEQLATAWSRLLDDPVLAQRVGTNARRRVLESFDQRRTYRRIQELYTTLLGSAHEEGACAC